MHFHRGEDRNSFGQSDKFDRLWFKMTGHDIGHRAFALAVDVG